MALEQAREPAPAAPSPNPSPTPPVIGAAAEALAAPVAASAERFEPAVAEPDVELPLEKRPAKRVGTLLIAVLIGAAAAGAVGLRARLASHAPSIVTTTVEAATTAPPAPTPIATTIATAASPAPIATEAPLAAAPTATSVASTPPPPVQDGKGVLTTAGAAPGRRIFVDRRTVGQTPASVTLPCGTHVVQIGSSGTPRTIDIPCGGELNVSDH